MSSVDRLTFWYVFLLVLVLVVACSIQTLQTGSGLPPSRNVTYTYTRKQDETTGITHHLVPGDFAFFHVGTKVQFSTKSNGLAFYAVTRPVRAPHPNLVGREEKVAKL